MISRLVKIARRCVPYLRARGWPIGLALLLMGVLFPASLFMLWPVPASRLRGGESLIILSSEGNVLRQFRTPGEGSYGEWLRIDEYPLFLRNAVLLAEDRRFFFHCGADPLAMLRAFAQNARALGVVSGGSTITQQLVRVIWADILPRNHLARKVVEIALACRLEAHASKERILESYLNRVPLRFNQLGFAAAARRIFNRDVRFLTREEQTALAILVRQNHVRKERFLSRFGLLWPRLAGVPHAPLDPLLQSLFASGAGNYYDPGGKTHHFEEWLRGLRPDLGGEVRTSISENLNDTIHDIVNSELGFLERYSVDNAAVVVLRLVRGEKPALRLVAMVGSRNFQGTLSGQVNGCVTVRTAGSSLKPFLYGLAMDRLGYRPNSIVADRELTLPGVNDESYRPKNYDLRYWGPITLREALGASRNIPAVEMAHRVGVGPFYQLLVRAGFTHMTGGASYYGPGLALGVGGARLVELARLYSSLQNGGVLLPLEIGRDEGGALIVVGDEERLFSERTAYQLTHILADREVRRRASTGGRNFLDFPFPVAAKTGTSKDYRDAWVVGYTREYVVGVWAGNFSGETMKRVSGAWGAGRIFQQVMRLLVRENRTWFEYPRYCRQMRLCRVTGLAARDGCPGYRELVDTREKLPAPCSFDHAGGPGPFFNPDTKPVVLSPVPGETFILDPLVPPAAQQVPVRISYRGADGSTAKRYAYRIDGGAAIPFAGSIERTVSLGRGEHRLRVFADGREVEAVEFIVE